MSLDDIVLKLQADIQALANDKQVLQQQLMALQQQQSHQAMPKTPNKDIVLPIYRHATGTLKEFREWRFSVAMKLAALDVKAPQSVYFILGALSGTAQDIARDLSTKVSDFTTTESFLDHLAARFTTSAHKKRALLNYETRTQQPNEPIKRYAGLLRDYYHEAFGATIDHQALISKFISGLNNKLTKQQLLQLEVFGVKPATFDEVVDKALSLQSNDEIANLSEEYHKILASGKWNHTSSAPEPMEVGACHLHPHGRHEDHDCRAQKFLRATKINGPKKTEPQVSGNEKGRMICYRCNRSGHVKAECRVKLPKPKMGVNVIGGCPKQKLKNVPPGNE